MIDLNIPFEDELIHHGVKGMKWGVRRSRSERSANKAKKRAIKVAAKIDKKTTRRIAKDNVKAKNTLYKMSDDELKKKVARLTLENNYNQQALRALQNNKTNMPNLGKVMKSKLAKKVMKSSLQAAAGMYGGPAASTAAGIGLEMRPRKDVN